MSHYSIEKLPGEPIVVGTTFNTWDPVTDIPLWADDAYRFLDTMDQPVYYIGNLLAGGPWSLDALVKIASQVARGDRPILHHPCLKETLIVTDQTLINLSAIGLRSNVFGNVPVRVFATLDEALAYARGQ